MEKKKIIIKYAGPIPELGNILGPIVHPYSEKIEKIGELVTSGRKVIEVNPADYSQRVPLTLKNYKTDNFSEQAKVVTPDPIKKEEVTKPEPKAVDTTNPTGTATQTPAAQTTTEQKVVNVNADTKADATQKSDFTKK